MIEKVSICVILIVVDIGNIRITLYTYAIDIFILLLCYPLRLLACLICSFVLFSFFEARLLLFLVSQFWDKLLRIYFQYCFLYLISLFLWPMFFIIIHNQFSCILSYVQDPQAYGMTWKSNYHTNNLVEAAFVYISSFPNVT